MAKKTESELWVRHLGRHQLQTAGMGTWEWRGEQAGHSDPGVICIEKREGTTRRHDFRELEIIQKVAERSQDTTPQGMLGETRMIGRIEKQWYRAPVEAGQTKDKQRGQMKGKSDEGVG